MQLYSYLSSKCTARQSVISGWGVYAKETIEKGELIAAWGGRICDKEEMQRICKRNPKFVIHPISVYENLFLVPLNEKRLEDSDRFNHSCNPNAGVKGQILLVARKKIRFQEEICFDYETTQMGSFDGLPFHCKCKSKNCRKNILGSSWKNKKFRQQNRGFFSWYLQEKFKLFLKKH